MMKFAWELNDGDGVTTSSRLRVWWLVHMNGYAVSGTKLTPQVTMLGVVKMMPTWVLYPPDAPQDARENWEEDN